MAAFILAHKPIRRNALPSLFLYIACSLFAVFSRCNAAYPQDYSWKRKYLIQDYCAGEPDQPLTTYCAECHGGCSDEGVTLGQLLNVAFNKPTKISSRYTCGRSEFCYGISPDGCAVVNGRTDSILSTGHSSSKPHNCIHTADDTLAYWWVYLAKAYTITYVWIKESFSRNELRYARMFGLKVHVDAVICFSFPEYSSYSEDNAWVKRHKNIADLTFVAECKYPITGTFIRLQKDYIDMYPKEYQFITICEVQTYVCPHGTYSPEWKFTYEGKAGVLPTCRTCPQNCKYPCDNVFGCKETFPGRPYNVLIHKPTTAYSESQSHPSRQAVDGVAYPRQRFCYASNKRSRSEPNHYLRIHLGGLHVIYSVKVTALYANEGQLNNLEVRIARNIVSSNQGQQSGDVLCWKYDGYFEKDEHEQACSQCPHNCPRGSFVSFVGMHLHLRMCEAEAFGYPIEEKLFTGDSCNSHCELSVCAFPLVCEHNMCKARLGAPCEYDRHCLAQHVCDSGSCKLEFNARCGLDPSLNEPLSTMCAFGLKCSSDFYCMKDLGSICNTSADCADQGGKTVTCDLTGKCKLALSQPCTSTAQCGGGAICTNSKCECAPRMVFKGQFCVSDVFVGMACEQASNCNKTNYECKDGTCKCVFGYGLYSLDYSCRHKTGADCNNNTDCAEGLVCQARGDTSVTKCYIQSGFPCDPGASSEECANGNECESLGRRCKVAVGQFCTRTEDCVSRTVCDISKTCKLLKGQNCTLFHKYHPDPCEDGFVCAKAEEDNTLKCRIRLGKPCSLPDKNILCEYGAICDSLDSGAYLCRLDVNSSCANDRRDLCRTNAVCSLEKPERCLLAIGQRCRSDAMCHLSLCDDGTCKLQKGMDCSGYIGFCRLRSFCSPLTSRCVCVPEVTDTTSEDCKLKEAETDDHLKQFLGSLCDPTKKESCGGESNLYCGEYGKCVCGKGFAQGANLKCKPEAGSFCTRNGTDNPEPCVSGSVCRNNQCRILPHQPCDRNLDYCIGGTTCDVDNTCGLDIGKKCQHSMKYCKNGTVCDMLNMCKIPVNATSCFSDKDCVAGAFCKNPESNNRHCECNPTLSLPHPNDPTSCQPLFSKVMGLCQAGLCEAEHATCDNGTCVCSDGYEAQDTDLSCKKALGSACTADEECVIGTECDTSHKVCKGAAGSSCDLLQTNPCVTGSVCDVDAVCRMDLGKSCHKNESEVPCTLGTVCDLLGMCKKVVGMACDPSPPDGLEQCVAGAMCKHYKCVCNYAVVATSRGYCDPKAGRIGGRCLFGSICDVEGSFCNRDTDRCECKLEQVRSSDLSCITAGLTKYGQNNEDHLIIGLVLGCCMLAIGAAIFTVRKRKQIEKREQLMKEVATRRSSICHLKSEAMQVLGPDPVSLQQSETSDLESSVDSPMHSALTGLDTTRISN